jgi:hypothetical protein
VTEPHIKIEDEQRRMAELVSSFDAPAPESLHRQVVELVAAHQGSTRQDRRRARDASRRRPLSLPLGLAGAAGLAVVAIAVAIVVGLGGGGSHALSMRQAAAPTLRAATLPAPRESSADHAELAAAVDGVPFPYWGERFGWRSTGTRSDRIDGRTITTVFYSDSSGRRIGYAILAGTPAPRIGGGRIAVRGGVPYRLLTVNGAPVVTWMRDGHLCVVSGHGVSSATLLRLASWGDRGPTAS